LYDDVWQRFQLSVNSFVSFILIKRYDTEVRIRCDVLGVQVQFDIPVKKRHPRVEVPGIVEIKLRFLEEVIPGHTQAHDASHVEEVAAKQAPLPGWRSFGAV
jgi:hypothetical protein